MRASLSTIGSFRFLGFLVLLVLFVFLPLLTSCSMPNARENRLRHSAAPERLTAAIALRVLDGEASSRTIGVVVLNPAEIPIRSVRSWVRFDPAVMEVAGLSIADDRFTLFAPGERTIDSAEGFVKLGAAARSPITDREILFATFTLRLGTSLASDVVTRTTVASPVGRDRSGASDVPRSGQAVRQAQGKPNGSPVLSFHDWRAEGDGHTAVLSVEDGVAVNVLGVPSPLQL